jgi:hypothetical protein
MPEKEKGSMIRQAFTEKYTVLSNHQKGADSYHSR